MFDLCPDGRNKILDVSMFLAISGARMTAICRGTKDPSADVYSVTM